MSATPISDKHAGLVHSHRWMGAMFSDMVALERHANELREQLEEARRRLDKFSPFSFKTREFLSKPIPDFTAP